MAMGGLRPVVAVYSTFLTRAFDQVMYDVGLHGQPVVFAVDRAGITGDDGASHHGVLDMVLLTKVPGMTVFAPSSYQELGRMLDDALDITDGPVAIRCPKTPARSVGPTTRSAPASPGRQRAPRRRRVPPRRRQAASAAAEAAADALAAEGISATVWDVRCVKPLDAGDARRRRRAPGRRHRRGRPPRRRRRRGHRRRASPPHAPSAGRRSAAAGVGARRARRATSPQGKPDDILADARPRRRRRRRRHGACGPRDFLLSDRKVAGTAVQAVRQRLTPSRTRCRRRGTPTTPGAPSASLVGCVNTIAGFYLRSRGTFLL